MSQENVELAKRVNQAGLRGDVEGAFEFVAEDVVARWVDNPLDIPDVVYGREALLASYEQLAEVFDDYVREVVEYVDAGDWVIAVGRWAGTGRASGIAVEERGTTASRWQEGKVVEWLFGFESKEAALEAVGCGSRRCRDGRPGRRASRAGAQLRAAQSWASGPSGGMFV